ncbi:MAG: arsenate reductase family protein [Bacteroidales bacterium]|jgi:arsenate reductase (glutaredoxin)|nr:arsenate reductase family protein [Bacteroidales bacterium]
MITVYHNPKCRKSRAGLDYVKSTGAEVEVREYIREGISANEVKQLTLLLGIKPIELVRTQEEYYRENLKDQNLTDDDWYSILSENPRLIKRPVVVCDGRAVLADPPEKAGLILNKA